MIIEVLLIVTLFLWLLSLLPVPQVTPFAWAGNWLAWISMVLLTLYIFLPAIRG